MSLEEIDALQGRSKEATHSSYFTEDPTKLKEKYIEHLHCLTINMDVTQLDIKSPEFVKLENENTNLRTELDKMDNIMERLTKLEQNMS